MTHPNYLRSALLIADSPTRRGLLHAMRNKINEDPQNTDPLTHLWYAIYQQIVDLDTEEGDLLERLEEP